MGKLCLNFGGRFKIIFQPSKTTISCQKKLIEVEMCEMVSLFKLSNKIFFQKWKCKTPKKRRHSHQNKGIFHFMQINRTESFFELHKLFLIVI